MKPQVETVYKCPRTGEPAICEVCKQPIEHRVEELVPAKAKWRARCETHNVELRP